MVPIEDEANTPQTTLGPNRAFKKISISEKNLHFLYAWWGWF